MADTVPFLVAYLLNHPLLSLGVSVEVKPLSRAREGLRTPGSDVTFVALSPLGFALPS